MSVPVMLNLKTVLNSFCLELGLGLTIVVLVRDTARFFRFDSTSRLAARHDALL